MKYFAATISILVPLLGIAVITNGYPDGIRPVIEFQSGSSISPIPSRNLMIKEVAPLNSETMFITNNKEGEFFIYDIRPDKPQLVKKLPPIKFENKVLNNPSSVIVFRGRVYASWENEKMIAILNNSLSGIIQSWKIPVSPVGIAVLNRQNKTTIVVAADDGSIHYYDGFDPITAQP